jgi:hypothetical protein
MDPRNIIKLGVALALLTLIVGMYFMYLVVQCLRIILST